MKFINQVIKIESKMTDEIVELKNILLKIDN